ncbi:MAG: hypothetical protein KDC83_03505 [Flavobacteriales bacterium]|nr:hypothetical protein [Flavobacteriales bacterium]
MLAEDILVSEIPTLSENESVAQAIEWMDEFKVTHLAVAKGSNFLGLVQEDYLLNIADPTEPIKNHLQNLTNTFVYENEHIFQVVKRVEEFHLSLIPVLSIKDEFVGITTVANLMEMIADMPVVKSPGGIIILHINRTDYSLTEISKLVENSDAKILGAFVTRNIDDYKFELTLKLDKSNISGIAENLEQFGYEISASYDQTNSENDVFDNYNNLMNYLNI